MKKIKTILELGKFVREVRRSEQLTQTELAGACGTSVRFIVELEKGKSTCQIGKVLHVLAMLGIAVSMTTRKR